MISYNPLWRTMEKVGATTYTLRKERTGYNIGGATITRLKNNQSVSTTTLDTLCKNLKCELSDIAEYIPD